MTKQSYIWTALIVSMTATGVHAEAHSNGPIANEGSALTRLWIGAHNYSNVLVDGIECDDGGIEFCEGTFSVGGHFASMTPLSSGAGLITDFTGSFTDQSDSTRDTDNPGIYGALGVHYVSAGDDPWGVFGVLTAASGHNDNDSSGLSLGIGAEKRFGPYWAQIGYLQTAVDTSRESGYDGLENMAFVSLGTDISVGMGMLELGAIVGQGDYTVTGIGQTNDSFDWWQLSADYTRPIGNSGVDFYTGLAFDSTDDGPDEVNDSRTRVIDASLKFGIQIALGGNGAMPFKTPDFGSPMENTSEF